MAWDREARELAARRVTKGMRSGEDGATAGNTSTAGAWVFQGRRCSAGGIQDECEIDQGTSPASAGDE